MHSNIFKLQFNLNEDYQEINEYDFYENGFIDGYHDYVRSLNEEETNDAYNWLVSTKRWKNIFKNFRKENDFYIAEIHKSDVKYYLNQIIELAKQAIDEIDFKKIDGLYDIKSLISGDKFGFYFYFEDVYYTDTEFLETMFKYYFKDKDFITVRFEGSLDYHS